MNELALGTLIMGLLGGLAIFLFGMEQMTDALKSVAGAGMSKVLEARGMGANVEIKASRGREAETGAAVARALSRRWMDLPQPPFVSSFSMESLAAARDAAPRVPRALLTLIFMRNWASQLEQAGCAAFNLLDRLITEKRVRAIRAAGYRSLAFTVNDGARAGQLLTWGIESVITDYPERMPAA